MCEDKDFYIRAIEYAIGRTDFTLDELYRDCALNTNEQDLIFRHVINGELFVHRLTRQVTSTDTLRYSLNDKFRFLEYTELKEARESSTRATYFAAAALIVSIMSFALSAYYSHKQLSFAEQQANTKVENNERTSNKANPVDARSSRD